MAKSAQFHVTDIIITIDEVPTTTAAATQAPTTTVEANITTTETQTNDTTTEAITTETMTTEAMTTEMVSTGVQMTTAQTTRQSLGAINLCTCIFHTCTVDEACLVYPFHAIPQPHHHHLPLSLWSPSLLLVLPLLVTPTTWCVLLL